MSQDQEEPVFLESTARVPAEEETQVGLLFASAPWPLLSLVFSGASEQTQVDRRELVCDASPSPPEILFSGTWLPSVCVSRCVVTVKTGKPHDPLCSLSLIF